MGRSRTFPASRRGQATICNIYSGSRGIRVPWQKRSARLRSVLRPPLSERKSEIGKMWHRSAVSSENIRFSTRLFLIYTAIAIASGSEELTSRSGHQLGDPAWIPPALSNLGQEKIHSDKHTYFANPWEEELLFPAWRSSHEEHAAAGDATTGYLAGYLHKAQTRYTIDHQINHHTAHPLIYKGIQEHGRSFYNHSPGDNCMASDSMEAINAISASDQLTQSSNGNPVAVSDYLVAGLIDDTFTNFDSYFNHKEAISPSPGYSSVQKWHLKDFPNPNCVQSDSAESSVAPSKDSHTTSPSAYQGNHVSMESNKEDKPWSPDLDHWTQNRSEHKIYEGVILLTGQSKGKKRKSFQSVESPYPIENFEQSRQVGKKRKSFQSLYSLQPRDNFRKLTLMDILNCKNVPQPIIDSLHDISKLLPQEVRTGDIRLKDGGFEKICGILRRKLTYTESVRTKDKCFIDKFYSYIEDPHSWNIDRYGLTKPEFKVYNRDNVKLYELTKLLPAFLNFVEIILAIIPWPKEQLELNKEDKFEFFKELEKAAQFFEDFKTYVMGSVSEEKDNTDWRVKKNYILNNPGKGKYNHTLWCALELWMKTHQKFIWHHLTDGRGNIFITSVKEFFNNIFFHGIEDLSRIISSHQ
ncbi:hypothetical protein PSTG_04031 [Puccinia striiformis f. sp. tritici PST-78]|uniref:Uncharacterized protein n=1 Tax=Puccinia striiformis f. sp. tritici PST-78 TaxID=1165861 RepID=A0A0L0VTZ8_9BASI|nr:hypothetical protein PSTG_04031 [Puccinia striiformis f. sp. tritici PST-78]